MMTQKPGVTRRRALLMGLSAVPAAGLGLSAGSRLFSVKKAFAGSPQNSLFAMEPQPIYQLPHDHRFHRGSTYIHNDYQEWQYFTALGTDKKTGDKISVFICPFHQGWVKAHNGRANPFNFAFTNLETKAFYSASTLFEGEYTGTAGDPDSEDFAFVYTISVASGELTITYDHPTETWTYKGHSDIKNEFNSPYAFDVKFTVKAPGYIPAAYHGLENIGWDGEGKGYRHNPQTMAGLSRYIQVPRADLTGAITVGGREYDVEGEVWYEHQWGNFRNVEAGRYFWGYMRMGDGTAFTWRQYYIEEGWKKYDPGMTRFQVIHPDNSVEYVFGPSFVYTPAELWTSPKTGYVYPWYGRMKTPLGEFYFNPPFPEQETPTNDGATWLDFYGALKIFSDNDEYLGSNKLSQDPLWSLEAHLSHDVSPAVWIEAGMIYGIGGAISINGTEQVEEQRTLQGVLGFKAPLWKKRHSGSFINRRFTTTEIILLRGIQSKACSSRYSEPRVSGCHFQEGSAINRLLVD